MLADVPASLSQNLKDHLGEVLSSKVTLLDFSFVSGGCINHGGKLSTSSGDYFLKWNSAKKFPGMFVAEGKGLNILQSTQSVLVPGVILVIEGIDYQCILLEWISSARQSKQYWDLLGRQLARLHQHSAKTFGLEHDNYIGSLFQSNSSTFEWTDFFADQRIRPLVKRLVDSGQIDFEFSNQVERVLKKLNQIFPKERPSLIHGDLWSGNVMTDTGGHPIVIDPAVYYGHREIELAFTRLFGGFRDQFYHSYNEAYPLEPMFENRVELYNLYPILVHANLFGGSYLMTAKRIIKHFS
ncbi:MAG TPA: fructosamine kinase family protein [Cyclobacteriaceae bacterium]|nr:fructosamine kinase family protein [Cyclobacteriaceae bacterium]